MKTNSIRLQESIARRYEGICAAQDLNCPKRLDLMMTLFYGNQDDTLDYERLLAFPDFDFVHDVAGMLRHMNRKTCVLDPLFSPRCTVHDWPATA